MDTSNYKFERHDVVQVYIVNPDNGRADWHDFATIDPAANEIEYAKRVVATDGASSKFTPRPYRIVSTNGEVKLVKPEHAHLEKVLARPNQDMELMTDEEKNSR